MFFEEIFMNDNKNELFSASEGFLYGNMFKDEYVPYKEYKPLIIAANDEKGKILLMIYQLDFAMNDLSLYLDLNPNDKEKYLLFRDYTDKLNMYVKSYEEKYGPLELCNSDYENYEWVKSALPFKEDNI